MDINTGDQSIDQSMLSEKILNAGLNDDLNGVKEAIRQGADVNFTDEFGRTLLAQLTWSDSLSPSLLRFLTEAGADINARDNDGKTPIFSINNTFHQDDNNHLPSLFKTFVELGASIDIRDNKGNTPLLHFAWNNPWLPVELLEAYVECGGDINVQDNRGETLLMIAATNNYYFTTKLLKKYKKLGADFGARNKEGQTALMRAAIERNLTPELLKTFVECGADINARDKDGTTPLMFNESVNITNRTLWQTFIDCGADILCTNNEGETALSRSVWKIDFAHKALSLLAFFSFDYSIRDMYPDWTPENFMKKLRGCSLINASECTAYAILAAISLMNSKKDFGSIRHNEEYKALSREIYGKRAERGMDMVLSVFASAEPETWTDLIEGFLSVMADSGKKQFPISNDNAPVAVKIFLRGLDLCPGCVVKCIKQHVGKRLETWVDKKVDGADELVAKLVPYMKTKYISTSLGVGENKDKDIGESDDSLTSPLMETDTDITPDADIIDF